MLKLSLVLVVLAASSAAQEIGEPAPAIACANWINTDAAAAPSLESLKGKVVLLEFWFST